MKITIGKYTLETLTTGMYDRPKDLYREYIQNSVDAIDAAVASGQLLAKNASVEIQLSKRDRQIQISDNGTGIAVVDAERFLLDIGNSTKIFAKEQRGFRGIGRLAGLAYCKRLMFETSVAGEDKKTIVIFDAEKLRSDMVDEDILCGLESIFASAVTTIVEDEKRAAHYFKVTLFEVEDIDGILDTKKVTKYLEQVAPLDFSREFKWGDMVCAKLAHAGLKIPVYNISIGDESGQVALYKEYRDQIIADRLQKVQDEISEIHVKKFIHDEEVVAYLWYAQTSYLGTIQNEATKGIRLRSGNIQLGGSQTLSGIFSDERFNGWLVGELHIVSKRLVPNARRDNIEKTVVFNALLEQLREWANGIAVDIRKASGQRNADKKAQKIIEMAKKEPLSIESIPPTVIIAEGVLGEQSEIDEINHTELISAIDLIMGLNRDSTKYKALNIQRDITVDQKMVLERVFDILQYSFNANADSLITAILRNFVPKAVVASR